MKLAAKTREKYSDVMNNIRTRITFEILRSVLVDVRGVRGKIRQMKVDPNPPSPSTSSPEEEL